MIDKQNNNESSKIFVKQLTNEDKEMIEEFSKIMEEKLSEFSTSILDEYKKILNDNNKMILQQVRETIKISFNPETGELKKLYSHIDKILDNLQTTSEISNNNNNMLNDMTKKLNIAILTNELTFIAENTRFFNKKSSQNKINSIKEELQGMVCSQ
ncbi:hypothetical protein [Clostridium butyricum]|uniref:hypothetical protein n=1 Tax=Clostridium butyricum TaxID=1492 RepID=UPI00374FC9FD